MFKFYGFGCSNYYNVVKMVFFEKGVEFDEVKVFLFQEEDFFGKSFMGKVLCFEMLQGFLMEMMVIVEYVDEVFDGLFLFFGDVWQ